MQVRIGLSRRFISRSYLYVFLLFGSQVMSDEITQIETQKIAQFISSIVGALSGNAATETNASTRWQDFPEIKEISTYQDMTRAVVLDTTLDYLGKNGKKIFPSIENNDQVAIYVESRLIALGYLSTLVADTPYDRVIKDYLDGEIADLQKMLNGPLKYGGTYSKGREIRDDKRGMLLHKSMDFVKEKINLKIREPNIASVFANKTSILALKEACRSNPGACLRLSEITIKDN